MTSDPQTRLPLSLKNRQSETVCDPRADPLAYLALVTLGLETEVFDGLGEVAERALGRRDTGWLTYENGLKRLLDFTLAFVALVVLAPFLLVLSIVIRWDSKGPAIFRQIRVGKNGRSFELYKFRSMCVGAEEKLAALWGQNELNGPVFKMRDDPRLTRVGRFLRRFSIDELPQLLNILLGEMSIVGPRPPLPREVVMYSEADRLRLSVTPGLTCLWQVSGRSDTTFERWMELDRRYVASISLSLDLWLIAQTIWVVLVARGAY